MCGVAGIIYRQPVQDTSHLEAMLQCIRHRGPEDEGIFSSQSHTVQLGHRRLAIIDLSPGGHQPMVTPDGRFAITFNGEIYNYQELKKELEALGWTFCSTSDTEVLLYAYAAWGSACLQKLNGMFAFAVWDEQQQELFAARDRLGEKPFKYYQDDHTFIFSSELKAILTYPGIKKEVDWQAVDLAMTYRYVPAPLTGFLGIKKLPAGHALRYKDGVVTTEPYWQPESFARVTPVVDLEETKRELWELFDDAVQKRMVSDVPLGVFLSGGLDSSSVVAAMAAHSSQPIKTFSVGFQQSPETETPFAKLVAEQYQTDHTEIMINPDIIETLPQLVYHYEEPFFDNSAIPTLAMSKLTKEHATVVLTGDGGDELFSGYPNHTFFAWLRRYQRLPAWVYLRLIPAIAAFAYRCINNRFVGKQFYRSELLSHSAVQAYVDYYGIWQKELPNSKFYITKSDLYTEKMKQSISLDASEALMAEWLGGERLNEYGDINRATLADLRSRLADGYMTKVDIAGMAYALETRPPFLDYRLVEKALAIPETYKVRDGSVKWIWKEIVKGKLPEIIITRKKMGFGLPIAAWMREELYDYIRERLLGSKTILYQYMDKRVIENLIEDHKQQKADYSNHIWSLLLLEAWLATFFGYE